MRWFRRGSAKQETTQDPGRWEALLLEVRQRFGGHVPEPWAAQADAAARLLGGDDGVVVAAVILREFADTAHADVLGQVAQLNARTRQGFAVDRRNYRPLWRAAGGHLRWSLFELRGGLHPYVQVSAAVTIVGGRAKKLAKMTDPAPVLGDLLEILDLTIAGWEFGRVPIDADAATLADRLIVAARALHDAMDQPPPLPPAIRELMRRNNVVTVYEPGGHRPIGEFNPGRRMREVLLT